MARLLLSVLRRWFCSFFIRCLVCFPLVVGVLCLSLFCCELLCVFSSEEEERAGCFTFIVLLL